MVFSLLTAFGLLMLVAFWLCGTLSMMSAMRASMPDVEPASPWVIKALRPFSALLVGFSGALFAGREGLPGHQVAAFAALGIALGLTSDYIWRRVRKSMQERNRHAPPRS